MGLMAIRVEGVKKAVVTARVTVRSWIDFIIVACGGQGMQDILRSPSCVVVAVWGRSNETGGQLIGQMSVRLGLLGRADPKTDMSHKPRQQGAREGVLDTSFQAAFAAAAGSRTSKFNLASRLLGSALMFAVGSIGERRNRHACALRGRVGLQYGRSRVDRFRSIESPSVPTAVDWAGFGRFQGYISLRIS